MELRSGRRLRSVWSPGPRRPPGCTDGGGSDWISALPDEMLLQILVRLRCARAAALTSVFSRRWRGLWRNLPELSFREISLDATLDQVAYPDLSFLKIDIPEKYRIMDPTRVLALLRAAARLAPADLVFHVRGHVKDSNVPIEIPCFERATAVKLRVENLYLTPPAGAVEFPVLERLYLAGCRFDMVEMIQRCPHLRVLKVRDCWGFDIKVHSPGQD
uniref:Uncharacterized protein n=1 Tax=Avena sativa TaxID=4498 RepID=A0ACD5XIT6_AVESA